MSKAKRIRATAVNKMKVQNKPFEKYKIKEERNGNYKQKIKWFKTIWE